MNEANQVNTAPISEATSLKGVAETKQDIRMMPIEEISIYGGTQTRSTTNDDAIDSYAESIGSGQSFPPVEVYFDGSKYWLADGFHRLLAYKRAGKSEVQSNIFQGSRKDALLHALGANSRNSLYRSNADKRNAVEIALEEFKNVFSDKYSPINDELDRVTKSLESLSLSYRESTLPIPKTKPPNHKTRYIAAIIANCYYDKFTRWPITPSNNPKRAFRTHTEEICFILDKRNLYGIAGACNDFSQNPWRLWDKSPPFISR